MPQKKKIFSSFLILITFLFFSVEASSLTCNPGIALSKSKWTQFAKAKKIISIEPFADQSKSSAGKWLQNGLPEYLGDLLATSDSVAVIKGIFKKYPPVMLNPNYIITGSYAQTARRLIVAINAYQSSDLTKPVYRGAFTISPPNTGRLFIEIEKVAKEIIKSLKLNLNKKEFEAVASDTASYAAYQSYIKALEAMWTFNSNYFDVANIWFGEAHRHDPHFAKAYTEQSEMFGYVALQEKARGKPYRAHLEQVKSIEIAKLTFRNRPSPIPGKRKQVKIKGTNPDETNRFLKGDKYFTAGIKALNNGNLKAAKKEFEKAVELVPEDTAALQALVKTLSKMGKPEDAAKIQSKISINGICH